MNQIRMVFSDIDGTLLNSEHQMTERTSSAIRRLHRHGIPFVFISARSREGIYPILQEHNLTCPVVACNGAMILDENGSVLHTTVMPWSVVREVLYELENGRFDAAWNLYTTEGWFVRSRFDSRIQEEERIVKASSQEVCVDKLPDSTQALKILCLVDLRQMEALMNELKERFPMLNVVPSCDYQLEIMDLSINKAEGLRIFCALNGIPVSDVLAFGDNYNDREMLECVGLGILMGNAPVDLKRAGFMLTSDNNHDGLASAIEALGL